MAGVAWQGRFGVTVERARKLAETLDSKTIMNLRSYASTRLTKS